MKYLNEHPQIAVWREKYELLQEQFDNYVKDSCELICKINEQSERIRELEEECKSEAVRADNNYRVYKHLVDKLNSLPWYKRLFKIY